MYSAILLDAIAALRAGKRKAGVLFNSLLVFPASVGSGAAMRIKMNRIVGEYTVNSQARSGEGVSIRATAR